MLLASADMKPRYQILAALPSTERYDNADDDE